MPLLAILKDKISYVNMSNNVFSIHNLDLVFGDNKFHLENIDKVSIKAGEILGILGESGCGKSTFGKCLIGLINYRDKERFNVTQLGIKKRTASIKFPMDAHVFCNDNVLEGTKKELQEYRRKVQMIFQNPRSALNLNMPVHKILKEAIKLDNPNIKKIDLNQKIEAIAKKFEIGGDNWDRIKTTKPKDLSGGERRRLGIAKVFATNPDVIIADEPVASLDVSVRGKILETLFEEWEYRQKEWKTGKRAQPLTIIIITHDFNLIQKMCHRTIVFYGDIHVKRGTVVEVFQNNIIPEKMHPYTEKLRRDAQYMSNIRTDIFSNEKLETRKKLVRTGCVYVNRCSLAHDHCFEKQPPLEYMGNYHKAACFEL